MQQLSEAGRSCFTARDDRMWRDVMQDFIDYIARYPGPFVTFVSAIVALISAILARRETGRQLRIEEERLRRQINANTLTWGRDAIDALAESSDLCDRMDTPTFREDQRQIARRLSALVDQGRMFFPNVDRAGRGLFIKKIHGSHKDKAFHGYRPPILDALMFAYYEVQALGNTEICKAGQAFIWDCRRLFVSELQSHIDPDAVKELIAQYNTQATEEQKLARNRASVLRAQLEDRRPGVIDESDVAESKDERS